MVHKFPKFDVIAIPLQVFFIHAFFNESFKNKVVSHAFVTSCK